MYPRECHIYAFSVCSLASRISNSYNCFASSCFFSTIINWPRRCHPVGARVFSRIFSAKACNSRSFSLVSISSTSQILSLSSSFFVSPIRKTECIEKRISSSCLFALIFVTLANEVRLMEGSIRMTKSTGIESVLSAFGRINLKETFRFLLADRKLLNANNPFVLTFI